MAEQGPRSIYNIVFIILLALALAWGILGTIKFVSAASNVEYSNGIT